MPSASITRMSVVILARIYRVLQVLGVQLYGMQFEFLKEKAFVAGQWIAADDGKSFAVRNPADLKTNNAYQIRLAGGEAEVQISKVKLEP